MLPLVLILLQVGCWQLASGFNLDVERAIVREGPAGSYFGFSVALLNNTSGGWLLAGAPLVKQNERSSGAIYKCPVIPLTSAPDCLEVPLSQTGAGPAGVMQIGVTLDMQPILKDKVVYCGHQIDHRSGHESNATVFGMCFELMQDLDYRRSSRIAPMTLGRGRVGGKDGQILDADNDEKIFYFPVHNSEGNTMIVGNPASQNGKGAVVLYRGNRRLKREAFKDKGGFAGYSLSSGRLFRDPRLYYLVGAPAVGKVHLLDDRLKPVKTLMGEQAGSYFGAAIAAVDLNGDGLDDIVVGAPVFSLSKEEGVVEVFISQNETPFEKSTFQLKGSEVPGARFGAAIENIGDMNRDTFEDIAVGAPFEDEGRGVVYIYNGFSTGIGLDGAYSQRIAAKELPGNIQGFGMSLSRVADLDGNAYRDLAIGAPQSDTAVVFLSRPVADLQPRFRINPTIIDPKVMNCRHDEKRATCIRIETCFVFRGYNLPNYLDVIFSMDVDVDADSPRVKLISVDGLSSQSNGTLRVSRRRTACSKYSAIVLPNVRDIYSPVVFNLAFDIAPGSNGEVSPVLSSFRSSSESTEVLFKRDCGDDNECHSDLVLNTRLVYPDNRAYLLLGVDETIRLRVNLLNSAEAAYLSTVLISHSDNVFFRSSPRSRVACVVQEDFIEFDNRTASSKNLKQVLCEVGNPIKMSEEQTFDLVFDTGRLSPMSQPVVFTTNARTASMETNYVNNVMRNQATLRLPVNTKLSGRSIPREMIVLRGAPEDAASPRKITHAYELIDLGPSVITKATVMLKIPTGNLTSDQVALDRVEVEGSDGGRAKCRRIRHQNMSQDEPAADMADQRLGTCSDGSCYAVRCTVKSLEPMQTILFRADMMLAEGAENLVEASQITLQTMAEISFPDDTIFMETEESSRHVMVSTKIMLEDYVAPEPTAEATAEPGADGDETSEPEPHPETEPTAEPETVPGEPDTGEAAVAEGESAGSDTGGATKISTPIIPLLIILTLISKIYL